MSGVRLLDRYRCRRANWGLGEWRGARSCISVVVKDIVLEKRI